MRLALGMTGVYVATMDQLPLPALDEETLADFPHSNPGTPTCADDLPVITAHMRTLESLEQRYAREQFARGRAVRYCPGPGSPVLVCLSLGDLEAAQRMGRKRGWK